MRSPGADPSGRLVATMLDVVVGEIAEPGRLRRGHTYAKQGAVVELDAQPGVLRGAVQGSERTPYRVEVRVPVVPAHPGDKPTALVPNRRELRTSCSCPDDDEPCKHAVAVLSEFSTRLAYDPSLFLRWRTGSTDATFTTTEPDSGGGGVGGARAGAGAQAGRTPAPPAGADPAVAAALGVHLGDDLPTPPSPPPLTDLAPPRAGWSDIAPQMLVDALRVLQHRPTPRR